MLGQAGQKVYYGAFGSVVLLACGRGYLGKCSEAVATVSY